MARKKNTKNFQSKSILIALEDTKSSRFYFRDLIKHYKLNAHVELAKHIGTNPKKVLEAIDKYIKDNKDIKIDKSWIVIDKDNFPKNDFKGTIETSRQKNVGVAYSNMSYELWLLLHFKDQTTYISNEDILRELDKEFEKAFSEKYTKSSGSIFIKLLSRMPSAIKRADKLIKMHMKNNDGTLDPYEDNPSTTIHVLILCLIKIDFCKEKKYDATEIIKDYHKSLEK